jgi:hypothetical protein
LLAAGLLTGSGTARATGTVAAPAVTVAPPANLLAEAYKRKASGDLGGAALSFRQAQAAGADAQRVALELGYLENARGSVGDARAQFAAAADGPDYLLAAQARRELAVLPQRVTADLYADAFGWHRASGANALTDLVPTVRVRAFFRPFFALDLQLYGYMQATRDAASRGRDAAGVPAVYADDYALVGGGLMLRLAQRRVGLFVQGGPAFNLLDDGRPRRDLDLRGGGFFGFETGGCRPDPAGPAFRLDLCSDAYGEAVYVSRFQDNVIGFGRAHLGAGYLVTGPVAWQALLQVRASGDRNADYYNNFADGGVAHRWRLLGAVPLDLTAGVSAGRYFGRAGVDPAPGELRYLDLRLMAATHVEF